MNKEERKNFEWVRDNVHGEQAQEPVAWLNPYGGVVQKRMDGHERTHYTIPLYTSPPQRQPLSDEDIDNAINALFDCEEKTWRVRMRAAIEAAHGIKGEA